jgi:plastocyanin
MRRATICAATALAALLATLGCISERSTGNVDLAGCNAQLPSEAFGSTIVIIRNFNFSPAQVRVRPGTKVTWVNCETPGTDSHTSTSNGGVWNSPLLAPGATFTQSFATAGAFAYHCTPHPTMTGTVTVE